METEIDLHNANLRPNVDTPWQSDEVYRMTPDTLLSDIENVGNAQLEILTEARLQLVRDIFSPTAERDIQDAIARLRTRYPEIDNRLWRVRGLLCTKLVERVRNAEATPYHPWYLLCPISGDLFDDPVITPDGNTYERWAIEAWLKSNPTEPLTRNSLTDVERLPSNLAIRDAVGFYRRHAMRFNVLLKR